MKKFSELKLPFGLRDGQLVQVSDVEQGLKCNCYCPSCNHPLVAKKGNEVVHHFAHDKKADCEKALETSLHLAAKKVIEESGYILLPNVQNDIFWTKHEDLMPATELHFDRIYLEKKYDDFVPDIILEKNGKLLCVEIFVTHVIDEAKKSKLEKSNISTIEIDLSKVERTISFEMLKSLVVESSENKTWVYNAKRERLRKQIASMSLKKEIIMRGLAQHVDDCPIPARIWKGKPYANFFDDCMGCDFFVLSHDNIEKNIMHCVGHIKKEEINRRIVF